MIKKAMEKAGYEGPYTEKDLIECYLDYADAFGGDLEAIEEEISSGELTIPMMCRALIRCN